MFLDEIKKFKKNNFSFQIKNIESINISKKYINSLNQNKFVRYNIKEKINKKYQVHYIHEHNISSDKIVIGLFNKNKLIGTCGAQRKSKKKFYIGIFIFNKKFQGFKLSKILISYLSYYLYRKEKISFVFASVNKKNFKSHNLFKSLKFKINHNEKKRYKSDIVYFVNIKKLRQMQYFLL